MATRRALALSLCCCAVAAGCGSSRSAAQRVCGRARAAARAALGPVRLRIASSDPANLECVLSGRGVRLDATAQATALAWVEYDTTVAHQVQAYGSGAVRVPSQLPRPVPGLSGNAAWIAARHEVVATNGTQFRGGSYVTVAVARRSAKGPASSALAGAVARAILAVAPRGPRPGPPPG